MEAVPSASDPTDRDCRAETGGTSSGQLSVGQFDLVTVGVAHNHDAASIALPVLDDVRLAPRRHRVEVVDDEAESNALGRRTGAPGVELEDGPADLRRQVSRAGTVLLRPEPKSELLVEPSARLKVAHPNDHEGQYTRRFRCIEIHGPNSTECRELPNEGSYIEPARI